MEKTVISKTCGQEDLLLEERERGPSMVPGARVPAADWSCWPWGLADPAAAAASPPRVT